MRPRITKKIKKLNFETRRWRNNRDGKYESDDVPAGSQ